ncbi:MAG TPA: hypothetical protein PLK99_03845 [Burkholderiales bacterium]|nr:hypothetical protein [Burkholderiales bacterium]
MSCRAGFGRFVVLAILGIAVLGWVLMALWNWLVPQLFAGKEIGYIQALGLLLLSKILFGGFRGHGCHRRRRVEGMNSEEREKCWFGRHCGCASKSE